MFKFIILSTILHLLVLFTSLGETGDTGKSITSAPEGGESTPLQISFTSPIDESLPKGQVKGFPSKGEAPSDTYVPDGTCAWSRELQDQLLEEAFDE